MAYATWPANVGQYAQQSGYSEKLERSVANFAPQVGASIERNRTTIKTFQLSFTQQLSSAEYDALLAFYRTTLIDGTQKFTRNHPRSEQSGTFKFIAEPQISQALSNDIYLVALQLRFFA